MKNKKIVELFNNLSALNLKGVKFAYAVARNISILKPHVESLQKAQEPTEEYKKFDSERVELAQKHAKKDEAGEPVTEVVSPDVTRYVFDDMSGFEKDFEKLKKTHAKAIEERETQVKEYNELLEKDVPVELHKVKLADVPNEITSQQMTQIFEIVED